MSYAIVLLTTFSASFLFIFLKSWQQRNVAFNHYIWILPTSLLMAVMEYWVIIKAVERGYSFDLIFFIGLGSGLGAMLSAWLHKRYVSK